MAMIKIRLEKLKGPGDWPRWKRQIRLYLECQDALAVLAEGKPEAPAAGATAGEIEAAEKRIASWKKKDTLAQLILVTHIDDRHNEITNTCTSAKAVWDKLTSMYEQPSGQRLDRLMEKFFSPAKKPKEDIISYVRRLETLFSELNSELQSLGEVKLPELLLQARILSTLPNEYLEFKADWGSIEVNERTTNELIKRLRVLEGTK